MIGLAKIRFRIVATLLAGTSFLNWSLPGSLAALPSVYAAEQSDAPVAATGSSPGLPVSSSSSSSSSSPAVTNAPITPDAAPVGTPAVAPVATTPAPAGSTATSAQVTLPAAPAGAGQPVSAAATSAGSAPVPAAKSEGPPVVPVKTVSEVGTIEELKLPNGLKVILLEDHSFPVFTCMAFYRVGARNENLGETGISHLVEHLLFEKVGKFRRGEIGATVARNGGMFNGFTSDDFTVYFETLAAPKLDLALRIESERMKGGAFTNDEVQAEIKRIGLELDREAKDSSNLLIKEVRSNAFQLHPYKNPTIGWRPDIEKLTLDDVRRHYKEYYQPNNATLILVGDFSGAGAISSVKKYFAGIASNGTPRAVRVVEPPQRAERRVLMKTSGASDVVSMAYHAPPLIDNDTAALAVLEKIMQSGGGGRLKSKLVDARVCIGARCSYEVKRDPGLFTVNLTGSAGVPSQKIIESFDALVDQLKAAPVSDSELKRARNHAEYYFLNERDGPYHVAFQLGYFDCLDTWQSAFSAYSRLRSVTASDVQRVAKRYFSSENRVVGVLAGQGTSAAAAVLSKKDAEKAAREKDKDKDKEGEKDKDKESSARGKGKGKDQDKDKDKHKSKKDAAESKSKSGPAKSSKSKKSDPDKNSSDKSSSDKNNKDQKSDKKKKSHRHHRTAMIKNVFGVPMCAYKDSDDQVVNPARARSVLLAQKPSEAVRSTATRAPRIKQATLKNGLTIAVLETKLSPIVQIMGAVKAGEAYEPVGKRGASTLLAELMNQGSTRYTHAQAIAAQDDLGLAAPAMARFDAGPQWINFHARCLYRDTPTVLGILTSTLKSPSLKDEDVERAKQVCGDRLKKSPDTVKAKVQRALLRGLIAPDTSFYPLDPTDKAKFISLLKAQDVRDFQEQAIKPDGGAIVFVGDISLPQAIDLSERACEGWTGKSTAKKVLVQPNPRRLLKSSLIVDKREDTMVTIGRLVDAGVGSVDYPLLLLADCALTNHPIVSRFAQKISGELNLSSSLSLEDLASDVESLPGTTVWSVDIPVVSNLMPMAVKSIQSELKKFAKGGLTPEEFNEVKLYLNGALPVRWLANSGLSARTSLDALMLNHQADPLPELITGIGLANVEAVNRFIKVSFKPDRSSLVMAGTKQAIGLVHGMKQEESGAGVETSSPHINSTPQTTAPPPVRTTAPASTGGAPATVKKQVAPAH